MTPRTRRQAQQRYQTDAVTTASPLKLIVLLYRRALAALMAAERGANRPELARAQAIVDELAAALDPAHFPELAENLAALYGFVQDRIGAALAGGPGAAEALRDARRVLEPLAEAWEGALEQQGQPV